MPPGPQWKAQVSSRASLDGRRLPIQLALPLGRLLRKWLKGRGASWAFSASASLSQGSSGNGVLAASAAASEDGRQNWRKQLTLETPLGERGNPPGSGKLAHGEPSKPLPSWLDSSAIL